MRADIREAQHRRRRAETGIEVDDDLWATLTTLGQHEDGAA